jgi:hypothetical protein
MFGFGTLSGLLDDVSCASPRACMAVGGAEGMGAGTYTPLALWWNGRYWRTTNFPCGTQPCDPFAAGSGDIVSSVSCASAKSCAAVGGITDVTTVGLWNGHSWSAATGQLPDLASGATLDDVACSAPNHCIFLGESGAFPLPSVQVDFLTPGGWTTQNAPVTVLSSSDGGLRSAIACPTRHMCIGTVLAGTTTVISTISALTIRF